MRTGSHWVSCLWTSNGPQKAGVPCHKQSKSKPKVQTPNWERVHFLHMGSPSIRDKRKKKKSPQVASKQGGVDQKLNINIWPWQICHTWNSLLEYYFPINCSIRFGFFNALILRGGRVWGALVEVWKFVLGFSMAY